ncbi:DUF2971 domain-containing protein [Hymenobacter convexus]|uniref:DUF2971 domain-containing protein n=1 Tax=Hymenobacter sp. CA1UV-4 TaxID=3063782 RepID=UPI00271312D0|nr:DUF2971 domain-containing protein [Hymenobacter sp. CA1UV-4]MDO7850396.1 DUF2971 domain-containing protein [Hymenobacter sp. CA1UV-4]
MIAYKYRGGYTFNRDLDSIAGDYFFAAGIDKLNDPFEATYSIAPIKDFIKFVELLIGREPNLIGMKESLHRALSSTGKAGIFSLAARPDDLKLWSHYASNHTGFCVGYEVEQLEKFNSDARYTNYKIQVEYSERPATLDLADITGRNIVTFLQKTIGTKHPEWEHEAETRIITDAVGPMPHDFRAIKSIHFGLHMPLEQMEAVMERMQGRGIAYYKMHRSAVAYGLRAVPVTDIFADAPRYLYRVGPIGENPFDTYTEGTEKEEVLPYIHRAVEVQRRDPYCSKVEYAERCIGQDRPGQIYVHYRYNESYYNRYFTREEIDKLYALISDLQTI